MAKPKPEGDNPKRRTRMRVISRRLIREFCESHPGDPGARTALGGWFGVVSRQSWDSFADVRATFAHADLVEGLVVFNVGGNKYRVVTEINFRQGYVFIKFVLTHKEYDRGNWKP